MGKTAFRAMTVDDVKAVAALDLKCFGSRDSFSREYFLYVAQNENCEYIIGEREGKIIACAGAEIVSDAAEIETIAVDPKYRRQGIGTLILIQLMLAIKRRGADFIFLEVRPSNTGAIKLYKDFGFQIIDTVENFYSDEDAFVMGWSFS